MSKVIELASGQITEAETITIELIEADDTAAVVVKWPDRPTVCTPSGYEQLLATATRLLANAALELAVIRHDRGL